MPMGLNIYVICLFPITYRHFIILYLYSNLFLILSPIFRNISLSLAIFKENIYFISFSTWTLLSHNYSIPFHSPCATRAHANCAHCVSFSLCI